MKIGNNFVLLSIKLQSHEEGNYISQQYQSYCLLGGFKQEEGSASQKI
jgi:hypothetical protein